MRDYYDRTERESFNIYRHREGARRTLLFFIVLIVGGGLLAGFLALQNEMAMPGATVPEPAPRLPVLCLLGAGIPFALGLLGLGLKAIDGSMREVNQIRRVVNAQEKAREEQERTAAKAPVANYKSLQQLKREENERVQQEILKEREAYQRQWRAEIAAFREKQKIRREKRKQEKAIAQRMEEIRRLPSEEARVEAYAQLSREQII